MNCHKQTNKKKAEWLIRCPTHLVFHDEEPLGTRKGGVAEELAHDRQILRQGGLREICAG